MDIIAKEDMPYQREQAVEALTVMIDELRECLDAAQVIRAQFVTGNDSFDFEKLREAIDTLSDQTDGYWHRLSLGKRGGLGDIITYVDNVETPYEEEEDVA